LAEVGLAIDGLVGVSIGALVGAGWAVGLDWRALAETALGLRRQDAAAVRRRALWLGGVRAPSLFDPSPFLAFLRRTLPPLSVEATAHPVRIAAVALGAGGVAWFGRGMAEGVPLVEAVYASCALPPYFPPWEHNGERYGDGGLLDVLPVVAAAGWGARRLIVVDVGPEVQPAPEASFWARGMLAVLDRALVLQFVQQRERARRAATSLGPPVLWIRPRVVHLRGWTFDRTLYLLEEGYRATREALAVADPAAFPEARSASLPRSLAGPTRGTGAADPAVGTEHDDQDRQSRGAEAVAEPPHPERPRHP